MCIQKPLRSKSVSCVSSPVQTSNQVKSLERVKISHVEIKPYNSESQMHPGIFQGFSIGNKTGIIPHG